MVASSKKILSFEEAPDFLQSLKNQGKTIVQCHGTFDLIHPGHVYHLEEAKAQGDILVVTVTAESHVNKGPGRPYFNDQLRVKSLAALEYVDHVIVAPHPAAVEAIACVKPDVYCKGKEYEDPDNDVTGNINDDVTTVESLGGQVRYIGDVVFSSSRLLNNHFDTLPLAVKEFCKQISVDYDANQFKEIIESFSRLKVLIVGDIIFDRYSTVCVQGLTSKNKILSGRYISEETQAGGALAVFRHIRQFTSHVKLISIVGAESWVEKSLLQTIHPDEDQVLRIPDFTTLIKQRFVEPFREGKELSKLFSVNYIDAYHPGSDVHRFVRERIESQISDVDLVLVADFGHGLIDDTTVKLLQDKAPFLALNCQTNSNNHGFNIINRKYQRADSFSLDRTEMTLACGLREFDSFKELTALSDAMQAKYAWLTQGDIETIGLNRANEPCRCAPFENTVVDTIGAGDAFCALASLAAVAEIPLPMSTFLGQLAGSQAVGIIGNRDSITKSKILKGGLSMLSF